MISCRELAELLFDFVAAQLPPGGCERLERHVDRCPSCAAYLESYRLTIRLARQLRPGPLPPRLAERLRAVLAEGRGAGGPRGADTGEGGP
jgi:hypothetical protein